MPDGERRLAAIMFTDMVGYTALGQRNESLSIALVEEQRRLIRPILARHNGREIKTIGDAFLVTFPNALDAVRCAYDIQRATREFNISLPTERRIHLRIGLHLGDVTESEGDISGNAVNVASRIEPLAEDGGVCLTRQVYDHVHSKFELPIVSVGSRFLKNVIEAQEIFKIEMPWGGTEPTVDQSVFKRIAVLPFASLSPVAEDEYFADGMTEEVISTLSKIKGVEVISRTSVMQYKKTFKPAKDISRELSAGTLLEGSIRKAGGRIRVTVQMIDAPRDRYLWAESYDRDVQDVFAIQSDIAQRVAAALQERFLEHEAERIEQGPTKSVQAYDEYLRGLYEAHRMSDYSMSSCISHLEAAVKVDESFAAAYAVLGDAYVRAAGEEGVDPVPAYEKAKKAIGKALALDESLSSAHRARGNLAAQCDWDWELSGKELRRAIELNASNSEAHRFYSFILRVLNKSEESEREALRAIDLDPLSWFNEVVLAWHYVVWRRYDDALIHARRGFELDPSNPNSSLELGRVYSWIGMWDEALESLARSQSIRNTLNCKAVLAKTYAKKGSSEEARRVLGEIERDAEVGYVSPFTRGEVYLALGNRDRAFKLFNQACEKRSFDFALYHQSPDLDEIRQDPRYLDLVKRLGLD